MFSQKSFKISEDISKKRLSDFYLLITLCFVVIIVNLWYLQIIKGKEYEQRAINNCIRSLVEEAPRGEIYDRYGNILVTNRPAVNFSVIPAELEDYKGLVEEFSVIMPIDYTYIKEKIQNKWQNPFQALTLKRDLEKEKIITIEEQKYKFKGILLTVQPERKYLFQSLAAHLIGYVNEISEEELKISTFKNLIGGDIIGKTGLERYYDSYLRGEKGSKNVEVDALGREIATINVENPIAGNDIYLTIDSNFQQFIEEQMVEKKGAIIVSDPSSGKILAMASYPDYNPNIFTQQITTIQWQEIVQNKDNVMCNRNIQSIYPPGSIFKLVVAMAALEEGLINNSSIINCSGHYKIGDTLFRCWKESGHGNISIIDAIANSCNIFFYNTGQKIGIDKLNYYAKLFGFGSITDIDLPGEQEGLLPSDDWKRKTFNQPWYPGDTVNLSIGQGYLLVTPLQIHNMLCIIANEGYSYKPYNVEKIISQSGELVKEVNPELLNKIDISRETFKIIKEGMKKSVEKGTGRLANIENISIGGKTGTAQNPQGENHAWFIGFAPFEKPEICVTVLVENGGDGSTAAAPIAAEIIKEYFHQKNNQKEKVEQFHQ